MTRAVAVVLTVVVLLVALAWAFQRQLIYLPSTSPLPPAASVIAGARDVRLLTTDGLVLGAWLVPGHRDRTGTGASRQGRTVLVASGNGGDRSMRAPLAQALAAQGLTVLLFDYRGYGGNPGRPTEAGLARDVRAAHRYLTEDLGVPPSELLYLGESLGAAVVTELAVEHPPAGLLLRSPFVDLAAMGREHYPFLPVGPLLRDRYRLTAHLARVQAPVTVVLGTADRIVPPAQSREVARTAARLVEVVEVPGADHNDAALLAGPQLVAAVRRLAEHAAK